MEISVLASGSSGNSIFVAAGETRLLVDFGLSGREIARRLAGVGGSLAEISAVLCTHDHSDHCRGLLAAAKRHDFRVLANEETARAIENQKKGAATPHWEIFESGAAFQVGALNIESFAVPHDAADTVGYIVSDGNVRLGICTDLGFATTLIRQRLAGCDALVIEFNHDVEMVLQSSRSWSLKQRILSRFGHLSNEEAGELLAAVASPRLQLVFAAHLSAECNTPMLAKLAARAALAKKECHDTRLVMTSRDIATELVRLA